MYESSKGLLTFTHPSKANAKFPIDKIKIDTYKVKNNSQDLNSFRNCDGILVRNVLSTRVPKVTFQLKNQLTESELDWILSNLIEGYYINYGDTDTGSLERRLQAYIYVPETRAYLHQYVYLADPEIQINRVENRNGVDTLIFDSVTLTFIGYGEEVE